MSALTMFLKKYGPQAMEMIKANPGKTALAGGALAGAAGLGTMFGVHETKKEIPHQLLEKIGLPPELWDQSKGAVNDALDYNTKHPIAGAAIGGMAAGGLDTLIRKLLMSQDDGTR